MCVRERIRLYIEEVSLICEKTKKKSRFLVYILCEHMLLGIMEKNVRMTYIAFLLLHVPFVRRTAGE